MPNPSGVNQYTKGAGSKSHGEDKAARLKAAKASRAKARREAAAGNTVTSSRTAQKNVAAAGQKLKAQPNDANSNKLTSRLKAKAAADSRTSAALAKANARKNSPEHKAKVERANKYRQSVNVRVWKETPKKAFLNARLFSQGIDRPPSLAVQVKALRKPKTW